MNYKEPTKEMEDLHDLIRDQMWDVIHSHQPEGNIVCSLFAQGLVKMGIVGGKSKESILEYLSDYWDSYIESQS